MEDGIPDAGEEDKYEGLVMLMSDGVRKTGPSVVAKQRKKDKPVRPSPPGHLSVRGVGVQSLSADEQKWTGLATNTALEFAPSAPGSIGEDLPPPFDQKTLVCAVMVWRKEEDAALSSAGVVTPLLLRSHSFLHRRRPYRHHRHSYLHHYHHPSQINRDLLCLGCMYGGCMYGGG
jgi:hypothetical protein